MKISVAYACGHESFWQELDLPEPITAIQAIQQSRAEQSIDNLNLAQLKIGIFGKICPQNKILNEGDRVEIYQSLKIENQQLATTYEEEDE